MTTNDHTHLIQRAETAMFQAELADAEMREALHIEAKDALIEVEMRAPGHGAWHMACLSARTGSLPLARKWLERAHAAQALPAREKILASAYLKSLHTETWFQEFIGRLD